MPEAWPPCGAPCRLPAPRCPSGSPTLPLPSLSPAQVPSVWLSLRGEGRWGPLPSPSEGLRGQARSSRSAVSVGTPLQEAALAGLVSTARFQVPPGRVFRPLRSCILSRRPQTSRSITETLFPARCSLVDGCGPPVEPGLGLSPLSRGPAPLSSAPCACLRPGRKPNEQVRGHGGQRTGRGSWEPEDRLDTLALCSGAAGWAGGAGWEGSPGALLCPSA